MTNNAEEANNARDRSNGNVYWAFHLDDFASRDMANFTSQQMRRRHLRRKFAFATLVCIFCTTIVAMFGKSNNSEDHSIVVIPKLVAAQAPFEGLDAPPQLALASKDSRTSDVIRSTEATNLPSEYVADAITVPPLVLLQEDEIAPSKKKSSNYINRKRPALGHARHRKGEVTTTRKVSQKYKKHQKQILGIKKKNSETKSRRIPATDR